MTHLKAGERHSASLCRGTFGVLRVSTDFKTHCLSGPFRVVLEGVNGLRGAVHGDAQQALLQPDFVVEVFVQSDLGESPLDILSLPRFFFDQGFQSAFEELEFDQGIGLARVAMNLADNDIFRTGNFRDSATCLKNVCTWSCPTNVVIIGVDAR
jgi:hypothetical protein